MSINPSNFFGTPQLGSPILSEQIVNQPFKFVQCSQIDFLVPADLKIRPNELSATPDLAVLLVAARTEFSFTQNHESREAFRTTQIMKVGKLPKAAEAVDAREAFPRPSPPGGQLLPPRRMIKYVRSET